MKKKAKKPEQEDTGHQDEAESEAGDVDASTGAERQPTKSSKKRDKMAAKAAAAGDGEGEAVKAAPAKGAGKGKLRNAADDPLVQEVIAMIFKGIADPASQKDGKAFVPVEWATKYKPKLGPYKKFLQAHPDQFALVEDGAGLFVIKSPKDVEPGQVTKAPLVKGSTWQKKLIDAWMAYCLLVPRENRDFDAFCAPLPRTAVLSKAGRVPGEKVSAAPVAAAAEPEKSGEKKRKRSAVEQASEAAAPAAAPAEAGKKKKKKKIIA